MTDPRTVHIVDDDEAVREASEILLESAGYDVVLHGSGTAFIADLHRQPAGCVLLDMHMPGLSGMQVLAELNARGVDWPVIIRTGQADVGMAVQSIRIGAFDFIEKASKFADLLDTIEQAFQKLEHRAPEAVRTGAARALVDTLTPPEFEVMRALLAGLTNKLVAAELELSLRSVESHRANILDKLKVRGLSAAVRVAMVAGMQPLEARRPPTGP